MLVVQANVGSWKECATTGILALRRGTAWPRCMQGEGQSATSRERPAGTAPASAASPRGTAATAAMGHAPHRGGRKRAAGGAGRRGGSRAPRSRRRCARSSWTATGPRTRQAAGPGWRTAEGASRASRRPAGRPVRAPPACRVPAPKARCGATCAGRGPRRGAGSGPRTPWRRGQSRPMRGLAPGTGRTARSSAPGSCACPRPPTGRRGCPSRGDATTTAGASAGPRSRCCRDAPSGRSPQTGARGPRGTRMSQRPWEVCSPAPATPTIPGRSRRWRTPTGPCGSSSPRAPTSAGSRTRRSSMRWT